MERLKLNKRAGDLALPVIIFLVLNIAFFLMMTLFVQRVSSDAMVYEETYAKKIGLILNRIEPGMGININVTDLALVAQKNGMTEEDLKKMLITIDSEKGNVIVKAKKEGGFSFNFFSIVDLEESEVLISRTEKGEIKEVNYLIKAK
jgi:hypothetical protein